MGRALSTLLSLAVLVGLGVYIYYTRDDGSAVSTENRVFQNLESDDLQSITVHSESGEVTTLEKRGDEWQIVSPIEAPAGSSEMLSLTSALTALDRVRIVEEAPANLAEFGLDPPRVRVEFKASGDLSSGSLLLGDKTATGQNLYAKRGDQDAVFLIPSYQESSLNRSTFDLRDKAVVKADRNSIEAIDVRREDPLLAVRKEDDRWRMSAPFAGSADLAMIEGLIGAVLNAQMRSIVTEAPTPQELRTWGLVGSPLSVTLTGDDVEATLLLGGPAGAGTIYAKEASSNMVVTLDESVASIVGRPSEDYRRRNVFDSRAYSVNRIEFVRSEGTVVFERVPSEDTTPDSWRRVAPTEKDVDRLEMEDLLTDLGTMGVSSFVPATTETGLNSPALTVTATFEDDNRVETVRFGRQGSDAYAGRSDEPDVMRIESRVLDEVLTALNELSE